MRNQQMNRTSTFSLFTPFVLLVALGWPAHAAPENHALPASILSLKPTLPLDNTSWLFLLETRTQWLLIIQDKDPNSNSNVELSASGLSLGTPNSQVSKTSISRGATTLSVPGSNRVGAPGVASGTDTAEPDMNGSSRTTIILEGNTLVLPLEPDEPPVKPSASSS